MDSEDKLTEAALSFNVLEFNKEFSLIIYERVLNEYSYWNWTKAAKETIRNFIKLFKEEIKKNNAILKQNNNKFTFTYGNELIGELQEARNLLQEIFNAEDAYDHKSHLKGLNGLICYCKELLNLFKQWNKFDIENDNYDYENNEENE